MSALPFWPPPCITRVGVPPYDIQERTFEFSVAITTLCRKLLSADAITRRLLWQLLNAATSVGANMEEADGGQSKQDFIAKTAIAKKEAKETVFWLRLIAATAPGTQGKINPLLQEAKEIAAIVTVIKKNAEENLEKELQARREQAREAKRNRGSRPS